MKKYPMVLATLMVAGIVVATLAHGHPDLLEVGVGWLNTNILPDDTLGHTPWHYLVGGLGVAVVCFGFIVRRALQDKEAAHSPDWEMLGGLLGTVRNDPESVARELSDLIATKAAAEKEAELLKARVAQQEAALAAFGTILRMSGTSATQSQGGGHPGTVEVKVKGMERLEELVHLLSGPKSQDTYDLITRITAQTELAACRSILGLEDSDDLLASLAALAADYKARKAVEPLAQSTQDARRLGRLIRANRKKAKQYKVAQADLAETRKVFECGQSALREETERLNEDRGDLLAKQRKLAYEQEIITAREQGIALREEELRTQLRQSFQTEAASTGTPLEREGTAVLGTLGGQGSPEMTLPLERVAGDSAASLAAMVLETERHLEAQEGGNPEVPIAGSGS